MTTKRSWLLFALTIGLASSAAADEVAMKLKSCKSGEAAECSALADMYENGEVAKQDYKKARKFYKMACKGGIGRSCYNLAQMYARGQGGGESSKKADKFNDQACQLGDPDGCYALADSYFGNVRLFPEAVKLFLTSCKYGHADGCSLVGQLFDQGLGLPLNPYLAIEMYARGCNLGSTDGCSQLGAGSESEKMANANRVTNKEQGIVNTTARRSEDQFVGTWSMIPIGQGVPNVVEYREDGQRIVHRFKCLSKTEYETSGTESSTWSLSEDGKFLSFTTDGTSENLEIVTLRDPLLSLKIATSDTAPKLHYVRTQRLLPLCRFSFPANNG